MMSQRTTLPMTTATIGPTSWRNNTLKEIKLSQNVVQRSDKSVEAGRSMDPLPHLRDILAELSNDEAQRYFRQTRAVVAMLRESMLDTNEEIKSLTRGKEALEKALEHKRKDLALNKESSENRLSRPARERERDGADDLLQAERMHLLNLKRILENQLQLVQQQLQVLDAARKRLSTCISERSRVLDLICHAISSITNTPNLHRSYTYSSFPKNTGSYSYSDKRPATADNNATADFMVPDALGPYTPEADQALQEAKDARMRSAMLRRDLTDSIDKTGKLQKAAHDSVNGGMTQKLSETVTLKQHLQVASGENRHSLHRSQRWYDTTERARAYSLGPVASSDLTSRERLDRPIIRTFQRHPGTNLSEAQEIIRGSDGLLESLTNSSRNIGLLKLAQLRLKADIRDKSKAIDVDGSIVRLRRRKANHRWIMGEAF